MHILQLLILEKALFNKNSAINRTIQYNKTQKRCKKVISEKKFFCFF